MQPPKITRADGVPLTPQKKALRLLLLLAVIALSLWLVTVRERAAELGQYGYPGIVLINAMASGTVLIPMPGVIVTYTLGGVFNPLLVGLAAAAGAALGELSGYVAGVSGQAVVENMRLYDRLLDRMRQHTRATVFVLIIMAAIPNPAFDLVGIAAGTLRVPLPRFILSAFAGNLVKMLAFAYAGAYSFSWLLPAG
ncbi:MAG: VTT domain-containing protein [Anaerolineales bacterium]|nr:VTT domain-containing protein [Anaerolineales bacterium]